MLNSEFNNYDTSKLLSQSWGSYHFDPSVNREILSGDILKPLGLSEEPREWRTICNKSDLKEFDNLISSLVDSFSNTGRIQLRLKSSSQIMRIWDFELFYDKKNNIVKGKVFDSTRLTEKEKSFELIEKAMLLIKDKSEVNFKLKNYLTVLNLSLKDFEEYRAKNTKLDESFERIERSLDNITKLVSSLSDFTLKKKSGSFQVFNLYEEALFQFPELRCVITSGKEETIPADFWIVFQCLERAVSIFRSRRLDPIIELSSSGNNFKIQLYQNSEKKDIQGKSNISYSFLKKDEESLFNLCEFSLNQFNGSINLISANPLSINLEIPL